MRLLNRINLSAWITSKSFSCFFHLQKVFAVTPSYCLTILSVVQMVCKLYIFFACQETLAILIFEDICSFHIAETSKSYISYFYFSCVLLACTFYKSDLEIVHYLSDIARYVDNVCVKKQFVISRKVNTNYFLLSLVIFAGQ